MSKGLIIGGEFSNILVREKNAASLELGELLIAPTSHGRMLLQVFDLLYGSQLTRQNLELVSGLKLEEDSELELLDGKLRNYILARLKNLALIEGRAKSAKLLPKFFTAVEEIKASDVSFLTRPSNPVLLGNLRSGSKVLDVPVCLDGRKALSHHLLIAGTTGRGKSVFMTNILWDVLSKDFASLLVLDPHDEYFERLKIHSDSRERLVYYTPRSPPPGGRSLKINLSQVSPRHFAGVVHWSDAQRQALNAYYNKYHEQWVQAVVLEKPLDNSFHEGTLAVVKRVLMQLLGLELNESQQLICKGVFDLHAGSSTISDIVESLQKANTVIIDTSSFHGSLEVLIGSMIANKILASNKRRSLEELKGLPVVSIVLEEAPRVLGKDVLERGSNVFSTIAREGRKFQVGLIAITQLPSLIPREVLANMNTKVIFGIELRPERQAIIESAAQDLSSDERMIASLDKGEIIVTSNFLSFAMPLKVHYEKRKLEVSKTGFGGMKL